MAEDYLIKYKIQTFVCSDAGNDFEAQPWESTVPDWLDVTHPAFPKYFSFSFLNKEGEVTSWMERKPDEIA